MQPAASPSGMHACAHAWLHGNSHTCRSWRGVVIKGQHCTHQAAVVQKQDVPGDRAR